MLRKIAQAGLSGLSAMVNGSAPSDPAAAERAGQRGPAIASADQPRSASGEFSVSALGYTARLGKTAELWANFAGKNGAMGCQPSYLLDITSPSNIAGLVGVPIC